MWRRKPASALPIDLYRVDPAPPPPSHSEKSVPHILCKVHLKWDFSEFMPFWKRRAGNGACRRPARGGRCRHIAQLSDPPRAPCSKLQSGRCSPESKSCTHKDILQSQSPSTFTISKPLYAVLLRISALSPTPGRQSRSGPQCSPWRFPSSGVACPCSMGTPECPSGVPMSLEFRL